MERPRGQPHVKSNETSSSPQSDIPRQIHRLLWASPHTRNQSAGTELKRISESVSTGESRSDGRTVLKRNSLSGSRPGKTSSHCDEVTHSRSVASLLRLCCMPDALSEQDDVRRAAGSLDWSALRKLSLLHGGFGDARKEAWPILLYVSSDEETFSNSPSESKSELRPRRGSVSVAENPETTEPSSPAHSLPHRDERQIKLDTDRSFVLYPVEGLREKEMLQAELNELLVAIFRKRPLLNYFQGYHDIVTVIMLTLPKHLQLPCAEKLSLHRLRDSMGPNLEPVVGLLRIMKNLIYLADPTFASLLERNIALPYFALSNLLTLFSHDAPTLPLIQHLFDYLLCRSPIAVIYIAAAVILSRKDEAIKLEEQGEAGMLHSLLSGLPTLAEQMAQAYQDRGTYAHKVNLEDVSAVKEGDDQGRISPPLADECGSYSIHQEIDQLSNSSLSSNAEPDIRSAENKGNWSSQEQSVSVKKESDPTSLSTEFSSQAQESGDPHTLHPDPLDALPSDSPSLSPAHAHEALNAEEEKSSPQPILPPIDPPSHENIEPHQVAPPSAASSSSSLFDSAQAPKEITLTSLLARADELYTLYPPSHPSLSIPSVMGPNSVLFTWSEDPSKLPSDDEAEEMATKPDLVVFPYIPEMPGSASDDDNEEYEYDPVDKKGQKRKRRKLHKAPRRRFAIERRTMVAGVVLMLSVALAVYGLQTALPSMRNGRHGHAYPGHIWKKVGRWAGGALVGVERILEGFIDTP